MISNIIVEGKKFIILLSYQKFIFLTNKNTPPPKKKKKGLFLGVWVENNRPVNPRMIWAVFEKRVHFLKLQNKTQGIKLKSKLPQT